MLPLVIADGRVRAVWSDERGEALIGAVVVQVDGAAVPPDASGFHLATGGEPDTLAVVVAERDGERMQVEVPRLRLGFEDWLVNE